MRKVIQTIAISFSHDGGGGGGGAVSGEGGKSTLWTD